MFIGHYGVALAAKRVAPKASLGLLVVAAQFLDLLWPIFVLTGIERVTISPGITRATPLNFEFYPYSHSLLAACFWSLIVGGIYYFARRSKTAAWVLAGCVVSHWVLDLIVHRPDLPLAPGGTVRLGLGLWDSYPATILIEVGLLSCGLLIYTRATKPRDRIGSIGLYGFVLFLVTAWLGAIFGPPPPSVKALALTSLSIWITIAWAAWVDAHRWLREQA